jgi:hypothetical protein
MSYNQMSRNFTIGMLGAATLAGLVFANVQSAGAQALNASFVPTISTVAGTGVAGYSGDGGPATKATLSLAIPSSSAFLQGATATFDLVGNLFFADSNNNAVRRIDALTGIITTVAGTGVAGYSGDNGPATAAQLDQPTQVSIDNMNNLYIADTQNCAIRKVTISTGIITTILGNMATNGAPTGGATCGNSTTGKPPSADDIDNDYGVVVDASGNVDFANSKQNRIFKFNGTNIVAFIGANNPNATYSGDGVAGSAGAADLNNPTGLAIDNSGNIYFVDRVNNVVRKYTATGTTVSLFAGTVGTAGSSGDSGPATSATLNDPTGVAVDLAGNVYIADAGNNKIRVVNAAGTISTLVGTGTVGYGGDNGLPATATLNGATGVAVTPGGDRLAIVDTNNNVIRLVAIRDVFNATAAGTSSATQTLLAQTTTAGTASSFGVTVGSSDFSVSTTGCSGTVAAKSTCTAAAVFSPTVAGVRQGRVGLTDSTGATAAVGLFGTGLAPEADFTSGPLTTFAGTTPTAGSGGDGGAATAAGLNAPSSVAMDAAKNLYIADSSNNKIRMVSAATGKISTFAGTGTASNTGDGGLATAATLNAPQGVAVDNAGNVYIADTGNSRIRVVNASTGLITPFAGTGTASTTGDGGQATAATMNMPRGMCFDPWGALYVADGTANRVRVIYEDGIIETFAGTSGGANEGADGGLATATELGSPHDVKYYNGEILISDTSGNKVRSVINGVLGTVAGTGTAGPAGDGGSAKSAELSAPNQLAVDAAGDVYIADTSNNRVRLVSAASGNISTLAGTGTATYSAEGTLSTAAAVNTPKGIVLDPSGNVYVADTGNNRIALISTNTESLAFATTNHGSTTAAQTLTLQNYGNQTLNVATAVTSPNSYTQQTGASTDCASSTTLVAGAQCNLRIVFSPTQNGPIPGTVVVTDNANGTSGSTQTITLTGTGVVTPANIAISAGNNQTGPPNGIFPTALSALVTDATGYPANGVNVTFTAPATGTSGTFVGGTNTITVMTGLNGIASATFQAGLSDGTVSITAAAAGVSGTVTFTEIISGNISPTLKLSVPAGSITYGQTVTVTPTLSPSTSGSNSATGTVTLSSNGAVVGHSTVTGGVPGTISFIPLAGTDMLTATYSGDANFSASTTATPLSITVAKLGITGTTNNVTIPYGTTVPAISGTLTGVLTQDAGNVTVSFAPSTTMKIPNVGSYPLIGTLAGSAASNYTLTVTGSPQLIVVQAGTTTTISAAPTTIYLGSPTVLTATVSSMVSGGPTPTGNVNFLYNGTVVGTGTLNNGVATAPVSTLPTGADSVTAMYVGNSNYLASTSSGTTVNVTGPDFALTFDTSTNLPTPQGGRDYVNLTVTPNQIFAGNIVFTCPALPATFACSFTYATLPTTLAPIYQTTVQIGTSGSAVTVGEGNRSGPLLGALLLPGIMALAGFSRKRKGMQLWMTRLGVLLLAVSAAMALNGCGNGMTNPVSPLGVTNITVTATAVNTGVSHSVVIPVTVTKANN